MPSGGKGPSGTTTTTSVNPTQQSQLPFLTSGWGSAQDLYQNNPYGYYPGTTLATPNAYLPTGHVLLGSAGSNAGFLIPGIFGTAANFTSGVNNIYSSPAFSGLSDIASGANAYLGQSAANVGALSGVGNQAVAVGNQAGANPYAALLTQTGNQAGWSNDASNELSRVASGYYLDSNPYLDSMFGSASDAVTRAYQTATAPRGDSAFSGAGRYGSGAYANSVSQNQQDLGSSLGNLSANIYGGNYQAERARQDAAASQFWQLLNQQGALQGNLYNSAGNQYLQGLQQQLQGLQQAGTAYAQGGALDLQNLAAQQNALNAMQSGYQTGNQQQLQALAMMPQVFQSMFMPSQAMIQAGQGLTGLDQAQIEDQMKRFYGEQQAPWTNLNQYMNAIGQPTIGSGSVSSPYFTNPLANVLGAATGGLGLYNGLSSAFGGSTAGLAGTGMDALYAGGLGGIGGDFGGGAALGGLGKGLGKMSDRRLKRDIEWVGVLPNGLSIYDFRYLWDDEPQIGLMADEVERVHPEAVIDGPFGFKTVDYARAMQ